MINFKSINKKIRNIKGNSLAEFAVTTAMMATLATTAAPRFSGIGEGAKEKKTQAEIDKIIISASNFYNDKVVSEGRGRFPGQEKYNVPIGGYSKESDLLQVVGPDATNPFDTYNNSAGANWKSIFGINSDGGECSTCGSDDGSLVTNDEVGNFTKGHEEFLHEFANNAIPSPYQDGHYIYVVIPGGQQEYKDENGVWQSVACNDCSPILYVADNENPAKLFKKYQP